MKEKEIILDQECLQSRQRNESSPEKRGEVLFLLLLLFLVFVVFQSVLMIIDTFD